MITHKERVARVIRRDPVDMLPSQLDFNPQDVGRICAYLGLPASEEALAREADNHLAYAYALSSAEEYLHNPPVLQYATEVGLAWPDPTHNLVYDAWDVGWSTVSEGVWVDVHPLADKAAWRSYRLPDPTHPHLMDVVKQTVEADGEEYFVLAFQHISLFERSWALRGYEALMTDLYDDPDFVRDLLEKITDYQVEAARRFVAAGVHGARIGDDYGQQRGLQMRPAIWRELFKPCLARIYAVYRQAGLPIFQHSCGDIQAILPDLIEIGVSVIHPVQPLAMPLEEVAAQYGDKLTFFGGIDTQSLLPFGTPDEIRRGVRACVEVLGVRGSYIVAPSQEIMPDVPLANIKALIEAVKEYRCFVPMA